ncbi:MAG: lipopolysaccharide kinase InaA family protein [Planctomycetaceae bacterium]
MLHSLKRRSTSVTRDDPPRWMARERGTGICVPECSRAGLIRWIDYPELPLKANTCETVKCGRSSLVVRAEVPCGSGVLPVAYKRFRRRNLWKVVSGAFKPARAARAWKLGRLLHERSIATPRPIFAVLPRGFSRSVDSYLATEWVDGVSLAETLLQPATASDSQLFGRNGLLSKTIAGLLGRMHRAGFSHRDLKPGNIMIAGDDGDALLVDLDGASVRRRLGRRLRVRNLSRLFVGLPREASVASPLGACFVQSYLRAAGDTGWHWRDCHRQLMLATQHRASRRRHIRRRAA